MSKDLQSETASRVTRRGFLGGIGVGAAGAVGAIAHPTTVIGQEVREPSVATRPDRFSRLFPGLPPFAIASPRIQSALREMGAKDGLLDAKDNLAAGPIELITNPEFSRNNPDNPTTTAGVTFLGQFLDHDMTFDATSRLGVATLPERSLNSRTPNFDLDSVYGRGPIADTHLYDPADRVKFKVEKTGRLRGPASLGRWGGAIIPDPRNDEHVIIGGLQAAFLFFHNQVVDMLRADGNDQQLTHVDAEGAEDAATAVDAEAFDDFRESTRLAQRLRRSAPPGHLALPVDHRQRVPAQHRGTCTRERGAVERPPLLQAASRRAKHSGRVPVGRLSLWTQHRPAVVSRELAGDNGSRSSRSSSIRRARVSPTRSIFAAAPARSAASSGGRRSSTSVVRRQPNVRPNKMIDTKISTPLFNLPLGAIASGDPPTSLPQRNLLRHLTWSLPSGQDIARAMGIRPLAPTQLSELATFGVGFERSTPLWYYILKEAELAGGADARRRRSAHRRRGVPRPAQPRIGIRIWRRTRAGGRRCRVAREARSGWSIC